MRILIAEDNPLNFELLDDYLRLEGHDVQWARDGREALDLLGDGSSHDLVLLDLHMPIVDGFGVLAQLPARRPAVIVMSADVMGGVQGEAIAAGADRFLSKPVDLAMFAEVCTGIWRDGSPHA